MLTQLRPDQLYRWGVWLAVVNAFLSPILQDFKLLQISPWIPAALFYVGLPFITICFAGSLYLRKDLNVWKLDPVELVLLTAMIWAWVQVPMYGGSVGDIGGNFLRVLFALCAYKATRLYGADVLMRDIVPRLARWGFWGVLWALFGLYALGVFGPMYVYLSLNSEEIFVAFAMALTLMDARRIPYSTLVFMMIVMGGRRGAILAALAMILLKYAMNWSLGEDAKWKRTMLLSIGLGVVIGLVGFVKWAQNNVEVFQGLPVGAQARIVPLLLATEDNDTTTLTGKRNVEVEAVFEQWADDPVQMFTGQGYGATWINEEGEPDSTVHFSPVAVSLIYGVPYAILIYIAMLWLPLVSLVRAMISHGDREEQIWGLVTFGLIVLSLTGFSIFQNYVLWIGLGMLRCLTLRNRQEVRAMQPAYA